MSDTYRLIGYAKGKPLYTRNERQSIPYNWQRHEYPDYLRHWRKSRRQLQKQFLKRFREVIEISKTNGWKTW